MERGSRDYTMQKWNYQRDGEKCIDNDNGGKREEMPKVIWCIRGFPKSMGSRAPYAHRKHCNITMSHFPQCTPEGLRRHNLVHRFRFKSHQLSADVKLQRIMALKFFFPYLCEFCQTEVSKRHRKTALGKRKL